LALLPKTVGSEHWAPWLSRVWCPQFLVPAKWRLRTIFRLPDTVPYRHQRRVCSIVYEIDVPSLASLTMHIHLGRQALAELGLDWRLGLIETLSRMIRNNPHF
jgi:hypothetical protein